MLLAAPSAPSDERVGAWLASERCASGFDSFGCTRTLSQSNPNIDAILIFRDDFAIRATVRSCDQESTHLSFRVDQGEWEKLSSAERIRRARKVLAQWAASSGGGCAHPSHLSFDGFEEGFSRLAAAALIEATAWKKQIHPKPKK
ncbi:hypothetical protein [Polymorphobacter sp.]|uniref:hypothetical protein n=1 Tax=Polymorphobacter sp. TaxID=1909290 RepID=UPI003F711E5A